MKMKQFAVYDEYTAQVMFVGTYKQCEKWIKNHDGAYYIEEF